MPTHSCAPVPPFRSPPPALRSTFADTYEEVMQEEFRALRAAYETKLEAARQQLGLLEIDRVKETATLTEAAKQVRVGYEMKLAKLKAQISLQ